MKVFYGKYNSESTGVVWTNGCYDVLHVGHIRMFNHCKKIAEERSCSFFVGIDSDRRVKEMKGSNRPINSENDRAEFLLSIKGVDRVYIYDNTEELENIIRILTPDVMVIGDEYKTKTVVGSSYSKSIVFFPKIVGYSTSNILSKID